MVAVDPLPTPLAEACLASARPERAARAGRNLVLARPDLAERLEDPALAAVVAAVLAGSRHLARVLETDTDALAVLADLEHRPRFAPSSGDDLARWRNLELLRLAGRDLVGRAGFEETATAISRMASTILRGALDLTGSSGLAVVAMGKLGGRELNWSSDVDVLVVGHTGDEQEQRLARRALEAAGRALRVDTTLRPEGRDGALVRTVEAYAAYWARWARPWEFQALLRARPVAGDQALGEAFAHAVERQLWTRPFTAEDLREVRDLKARSEREAARAGSGEIKSSAGGIRDIEFSAQLLQLVHGRHDPLLRVRGTLPALTELAAGGYVAADDAEWLGHAYRLLRRVEHMLQLDDDRQVHVVPSSPHARQDLARLLGWRDTPSASAVEAFDQDLRAARAAVRHIHEQWWFRPLLDAFTSAPGAAAGSALDDEAISARLTTAGFLDVDRTRQAVAELTRGLTRSSRLMQQVLPLLLDWLSTTPDPDGGLLGLRRLVASPAQALAASIAFRDSPETARRTCVVLGTSALLAERLARNPDLLDDIAADSPLAPKSVATLAGQVSAVIARRGDQGDDGGALRLVLDRERLRIGIHDVLGRSHDGAVGRALANLGEAAVGAVLAHIDPPVPVAVLALGRFGGGELTYGSDLDVVLVHGGEGATDQAAAERAATDLVRVLGRAADLGFAVDLDLRPEGRQGPLARSVEGHLAYADRWAQPWERLAFVRARVVAGDPATGDRLLDGLDRWRWAVPDQAELRAIRRVKARMEAERLPAGEDPTFHLKLGPGALNDVELTTQLLQLQHGVREPSTRRAIGLLAEVGALSRAEAAALDEAHRFCEATRDRWFLVGGRASDALPIGQDLTRLARSLGTTGPDLRDRYRQVTRRARTVVQHHFYGEA